MGGQFHHAKLGLHVPAESGLSCQASPALPLIEQPMEDGPPFPGRSSRPTQRRSPARREVASIYWPRNPGLGNLTFPAGCGLPRALRSHVTVGAGRSSRVAGEEMQRLPPLFSDQTATSATVTTELEAA